ncbi:hypothetical protein G2912_06640 [Paraburkholderia aspalathi]|nr:hypothetical protein [Paraburkholderia aspalathi]
MIAVAIPASSGLGAPLSGWLLNLHGTLGMSGWQWLFIIEAVPSLILGVVVLRVLSESPFHASWLETEESEWPRRTLAAERGACPVIDALRRTARAVQSASMVARVYLEWDRRNELWRNVFLAADRARVRRVIHSRRSDVRAAVRGRGARRVVVGCAFRQAV